VTWQPGEYLISWTRARRPAIFINDGVPLHLHRADEDSSGPLTWAASRAWPRSIGGRRSADGRPATRIRMLGIGGTWDDRGPRDRELARAKMGPPATRPYVVELETGAW